MATYTSGTTGLTYNLSIDGVHCSLLYEDSEKQTLDFTPDNIAAAVNMRWLCDWVDRYNLMDAVLYTSHPNIPWAYACTFDIEPAGNDSNATASFTAPDTFAQACVTATYKSLRYNFDYLEISVEDDVELLTIDKSTGQFVDPAGTPATDADTAATQAATNYFQIKVPFAHISLNYHNQVTFNEANAASLQGQLNTSAWSPNPYNGNSVSYAKGCAQYLAYSYRMFTGPTGGWLYDYTYKFIARGDGVDINKEFNPHTGEWSVFSLKQSQNPKYTYGNFSSLTTGGEELRAKTDAMLKAKRDKLKAAADAGNDEKLKRALNK